MKDPNHRLNKHISDKSVAHFYNDEVAGFLPEQFKHLLYNYLLEHVLTETCTLYTLQFNILFIQNIEHLEASTYCVTTDHIVLYIVKVYIFQS